MASTIRYQYRLCCFFQDFVYPLISTISTNLGSSAEFLVYLDVMGSMLYLSYYLKCVHISSLVNYFEIESSKHSLLLMLPFALFLASFQHVTAKNITYTSD